jgi:hypothetical protein
LNTFIDMPRRTNDLVSTGLQLRPVAQREILNLRTTNGMDNGSSNLRPFECAASGRAAEPEQRDLRVKPGFDQLDHRIDRRQAIVIDPRVKPLERFAVSDRVKPHLKTVPRRLYVH